MEMVCIVSLQPCVTAMDSLARGEELRDGAVVLKVDLDPSGTEACVKSFCDLAQACPTHSRGERFCEHKHALVRLKASMITRGVIGLVLWSSIFDGFAVDAGGLHRPRPGTASRRCSYPWRHARTRYIEQVFGALQRHSNLIIEPVGGRHLTPYAGRHCLPQLAFADE